MTFHEIKLDRGIPFARAREIEAQWLEDVKALQTEEQRAREQEAIRRQRQRARERMASHKRLMAMLKKAPKRTTRGAAKAAAATGGKGEEGAEKEDEMEEPEEEGPEQEVRTVWCGWTWTGCGLWVCPTSCAARFTNTRMERLSKIRTGEGAREGGRLRRRGRHWLLPVRGVVLMCVVA